MFKTISNFFECDFFPLILVTLGISAMCARASVGLWILGDYGLSFIIMVVAITILALSIFTIIYEVREIRKNK